MKTVLFLLTIITFLSATDIKKNYLNHSEEFSSWDSISAYPLQENSRYNQMFRDDTLLYIYGDQLSEWDMITNSDTQVEPWSSFAFWNLTPSTESFKQWDSLSLLSNEFQANSYNRWLKYGRRKPFDVTKVSPWHPDLALSYIPFGSDITAASARNPKYTGRVELPINVQVKYFSDRIALTPYREMNQLGDPDVLANYMTAVIKNSFNIKNGDSPEESSEKMNRYLKKDVNLYSHFSYRPFRISGDKGNMELRVYADFSMKIPGDLFGVLFTGKLAPGGTVDVSHLQSKAITAFALTAGGKSVSKVPSHLQKFLRSKGGTFKKAISVDLITGLAFAEVQATSGELVLDDDGSSFSFHGDAEVLTSGTGLQDKFDMGNPFENGFTPAGFGGSVDLGFEIADDKRAISLYFNNLGAIRWNNVKKSTLAMHVDSLDVEGLVNGGNESADLSDPEVDSLRDIGSIWRPVNTNFTLGMVQVVHSVHKNDPRGMYSRQLRLYGEYKQSVTNYPGSSYIPQIKLGIENDFLMGGIATGYYMLAGGSEHLGSGCNIRFFNGASFTIDLQYNAYGSAILYPKRGFGISAVTQLFNKKDKWLR